MLGYSHLLDDERDQIAALTAAGRSIGAIAKAVGRAKSTVSRELHRNALPSGRSSPLYAAGAYQRRRRREAILERDRRLRDFVGDCLAEGWTPEPIAGWLKAGHERGVRAGGVRSHPPLRLPRRSKGRGPVALSAPPSQAPPAAPGETLTRQDPRPRLHPRSATGRRRPRRHWSLGGRPHHLQVHAARARPA